MIAVDTNILVYAHRQDSPWHNEAAAALRSLAEKRTAWAIPWPSIHEFLAITTHRKIYLPPSTLEQAKKQVESWCASPSLQLLAEGPAHWDRIITLMSAARISGSQVHDARIAALCLQHGVSELWTADRDFSRFPTLKTRNPLALKQ